MRRLGRKRVDQITTADVMAVLIPHWHTKNETMRRVRQRIGAVMKWAVAQGFRGDNPAGDAISAALPKTGTMRQHQRALPFVEVGAALDKVKASRAYRGTVLALEFLVLTACRSGEVRQATWGEVEGRAGAKLIGEVMGLTRVALITLNNDFGKSLANGFKDKAAEFGIEITGESEYSIKDREFGPIVAKVKADDPEAIYASGYFFTAGPLVRQIRAAGISAPVIGQEGYDSQKFIEIAGQDAEGVIITTSLDRDSCHPITQAFIQEFETKAGYPADMVGASTHTAVLVIAEALKQAGAGDRATLRDAIASSTVDVSTDHISFNALGEVRKDVQVQIVKDGAWRHYTVISDPELLASPAE